MNSVWESGLKDIKCSPNADSLSKLKQYVDLLHRWNKTYNLSAIREPRDMVPLHIFDSLVVAPYLSGDNCLDVGSGAGLPTIPLAIIQPQRQFTALDTNGKKTRFIQQAVIELGLKNVAVEQARVENWHPDQNFDAIISRAFSSLFDFVSSSSSHLKKNGTLYAMKGQFPKEELEAIPVGFKLNHSHKLNVPFVDAERHLLEFNAQ